MCMCMFVCIPFLSHSCIQHIQHSSITHGICLSKFVYRFSYVPFFSIGGTPTKLVDSVYANGQ